MTSLNTHNIINKPKTEIDPNFALPPGVVNVQYLDIGEKESVVIEAIDGTTGTITYDDTSLNPLLPDPATMIGLQPPTSMTVVGQNVYVALDGTFAVDVVLEVEDIPGVSIYDVRVSKA